MFNDLAWMTFTTAAPFLTDLWVLMIGAALLGSYFLGLGHVS